MSHFEAVRALLEPFGKPVHIIDAPGSPTYPYVLLWGSPGLLQAAEADGVQDDIDDLVGVTHVAATPEAALVVVDRVRSYLMGARPVVEGRHVQPLRLFDSRNVEVDRDVTMPATNRHPAYAVDLYRLVSEPA